MHMREPIIIEMSLHCTYSYCISHCMYPDMHEQSDTNALTKCVPYNVHGKHLPWKETVFRWTFSYWILPFPCWLCSWPFVVDVLYASFVVPPLIQVSWSTWASSRARPPSRSRPPSRCRSWWRTATTPSSWACSPATRTQPTRSTWRPVSICGLYGCGVVFSFIGLILCMLVG